MRVNTRDINSTSTVSSSSGRGHVESLFINEEQKKVPRDVFDTFATHSDLVHYVTDTDSWVEMAAATVAFLRNRVKNCFLFIFHRVRHASQNLKKTFIVGVFAWGSSR